MLKVEKHLVMDGKCPTMTEGVWPLAILNFTWLHAEAATPNPTQVS